MKNKEILAYLALLATLSSCSGLSPRRSLAGAADEDPYRWLEDVESESSLKFAHENNDLSLGILKGDPRFAAVEAEIRAIALAKDRLPAVSLRAGKLYNFWQDADHVRGLLRRTSIESYQQIDVDWETVLDLDALAATEKENWVWKGMNCLDPKQERCLISLSRGGKDAVVVREFDTVKNTFVSDGFFIPEAKNQVAWADQDSIFVGSDFGPESLSNAGYPIVAKLWKRGTPLTEAKEIFRGEKNDVSAEVSLYQRPEADYKFFSRSLSFFETELTYEAPDGSRIKVPMPKDADFRDVIKGNLIYSLRSPLQVGDRKFTSGSVVALPLANIGKGAEALDSLSLIFEPSAKRFLTSLVATRDVLLLSVLDNVKGKILRFYLGENGSWINDEVPLGSNGVAAVSSSSSFDNQYLASYTDFLTPSSVHLGDAGAASTTDLPLLKRGPKRFFSKDLLSEQWEATSKDGTKIPYFIVHKKDYKLDGHNPTLLYGYGGFEIPMTPNYLGATGKVWLERGGVYVLANIRGGGEFGPEWHKAALRENRQKAFDDFIAVAEDLIARKVTTPKQLGIQGGSNGGLLMGATFVERPDLFAAVLCEVPLLDMLRYNQLLAGASWMEEYGDPADPTMREAILKYSPYQNVKANIAYPEVFFLTSTKDDRVHPAHARKMVARMKEQGHPIYYFENTEGGHGGSANIEQRILWSSLEFTYLWKKLAAEPILNSRALRKLGKASKAKQ